MTRWVCPVLVALIGSGFAPAGAKKSPREEIPELKVLDRFVGTWKLEVTNHKSVWIPEGNQGTATSVAEWTLNGRFIQIKVKGDKDFEGTYLLTYDPNQKVYRLWGFDSYGGMEELTGTWDGKKQAMTWTGKRIGTDLVSRSRHTFPDPDRQEWVNRVTTPQGELLLDQQGKGTK